MRTGITFTYLGVTVAESARVMLRENRPASNIFAAGEIMAGNILGKGYLAGLLALKRRMESKPVGSYRAVFELEY